MPKKKAQPEMQDRELWETLFPKRVRDKVQREVELEVPEKTEEVEEKRPIEE